MGTARSIALTTVLVAGFPALAAAQGASWDPYAPEKHLFEVGVLGGTFFTSSDHDLYEEGVAERQVLADYPPSLGLRASYFPTQYGGIEAEAVYIASATSLDPATLWSVRGHFVGQFPMRRFIPFVLAGGGNLAVASQDTVLGNDSDATFHWGLGAKALVSRNVAIRLDGRHIVAPGAAEDELGASANHFELLLGVSLVLGRTPDPDPDLDGVIGDADRCPEEAGTGADGCVVKDEDGDGVPDEADKCPKEAGTMEDGCPDPDPDGDGVPLPCDRCPEEKGTTADGCRDPDPDRDYVPEGEDKCPDERGAPPDGCLPDPDGDGFEREADRCPREAETKNGFEDTDGCPDELPPDLAKLNGVIEGLAFAQGSSRFEASSFPVLDEAAKVLVAYPEIRIEIRAHTDNTGNAASNLKVSEARAKAIKAYLVRKGVADPRLESRGLGGDEPVADNATPEGRTKNRRVEFKVLY